MTTTMAAADLSCCGDKSSRWVKQVIGFWCPYNGLLHPQLFTCNIYWSGVIFQYQYFLEDIMMYEEAHYRLTAFVSCWNRNRQMWYVWCPDRYTQNYVTPELVINVMCSFGTSVY